MDGCYLLESCYFLIGAGVVDLGEMRGFWVKLAVVEGWKSVSGFHV